MAGEQATQSWWQTLPGVMTASAGVISAITAMIIALHQAGLFKQDANTATGDKAVAKAEATLEKSPPATGQVKPMPAQPATDATPQDKPAHGKGGRFEPQEILGELAAANIGNSVGDKQLLDWLDDDDRTYRRIAEVSLELVGNQRLVGNAPDIDVIKYYYLDMTQRDGGGLIPLGERLDRNVMRRAILAASNDKNGTHIQRFDRALAAR